MIVCLKHNSTQKHDQVARPDFPIGLFKADKTAITADCTSVSGLLIPAIPYSTDSRNGSVYIRLMMTQSVPATGWRCRSSNVILYAGPRYCRIASRQA